MNLWLPAAKDDWFIVYGFLSCMVGFLCLMLAASHTTHLRTDVFHRVLDFLAD